MATPGYFILYQQPVVVSTEGVVTMDWFQFVSNSGELALDTSNSMRHVPAIEVTLEDVCIYSYTIVSSVNGLAVDLTLLERSLMWMQKK